MTRNDKVDNPKEDQYPSELGGNEVERRGNVGKARENHPNPQENPKDGPGRRETGRQRGGGEGKTHKSLETTQKHPRKERKEGGHRCAEKNT